MKNRNTDLVLVHNGRFGGGEVFSPFSMINDGTMELGTSPSPLTIKEMMELKDKLNSGGKHTYSSFIEMYRFKHLEIKVNDRNPDESLMAQNIAVDGEMLTFSDFVTYEVMP